MSSLVFRLKWVAGVRKIGPDARAAVEAMVRTGDLRGAAALVRPADERFKPAPLEQGFVLKVLLSIPQATRTGDWSLRHPWNHSEARLGRMLLCLSSRQNKANDQRPGLPG